MIGTILLGIVHSLFFFSHIYLSLPSLGILIENMRREGFEFQIGAPKVIEKLNDKGDAEEPYEEAVVEVPEEYVGGVTGELPWC